MNNLDKCANIRWNRNPAFVAAQCAADIWPQSKEKIVKNNWRCYIQGDRDKDQPEFCSAGKPEPTTEEEEGSDS